jgi:hypothetical protein
MMHDFQKWEDYLSKAKDKHHGRPIANNTRVHFVDDDTIGIKLHATDVVLFHRDGKIELNSGGWTTVTTKDRIASFSPAARTLEQEDGIWYVRKRETKRDPRPCEGYPHRQIQKPYPAVDPGLEPVPIEGEDNWRFHSRNYARDRKVDANEKREEMLERFGDEKEWQDAYLTEFRTVRELRKQLRDWNERNRVSFYDGIEIDGDGYAKGKTAGRSRKEIDTDKRRVNEFVAYCISELEAGNVPMPSGGDCWYCLMFENAKPEPLQSTEHLEDHIEERYVVPSMLVNAVREAGYVDAGVAIHLGMEPAENRMGGHFMPADVVKRDLRKYLYRRLIPEVAA